MKFHRYKSFEQLVYVTLNVGLIAFYFGFSNGYFNSLNFDDVVRIYDLGGMDRAIAQAWTTGVLSLTGFTGTLLCSYLLRVLSRRECLLRVDAAIIIISLLLTIPNIWVLLACRAVQGVCIGVVSSLSPLVIR
jgi:MFS family permease